MANQRLRRLLAGLLLFGLVVLGPLTALASHNFSDVPNSNLFHTNIERVYDARIAAGCGGGEYCPEDGVTREQMAAFLARTGGRVGYDSQGPKGMVRGGTAPIYTLASVTIRAGEVPGGTAFVKLDASVVAYLSSTACSASGCQVTYRVQRAGSGQQSVDFLTWHENTTQVQESAAASIDWVAAVPTGVDVTFDLLAQITYGVTLGGDEMVVATGALTATYFPFSEDGDDVLN